MAQARRPQPLTPPPAMTGGPGVDPEPELPVDPSPGPETLPPEPTGTSIKIGGREFTVDPELASALEGRETEFNRKLSDQGREVGDLRAWRRQIETQLAPKPPNQEYDYDTQIFERPREALGRFRQEIVSEIEQKYQGEQTQRRQWETFYKNNADLADEERLVKSIAQDLIHQGWGTREASEIPAFMDELAKQARSELLRIARKAHEAEAPGERLPRGRTPVESGGGRRTPEAPAPTGPTTITAMIQARQRKRSGVAE